METQTIWYLKSSLILPRVAVWPGKMPLFFPGAVWWFSSSLSVWTIRCWKKDKNYVYSAWTLWRWSRKIKNWTSDHHSKHFTLRPPNIYSKDFQSSSYIFLWPQPLLPNVCLRISKITQVHRIESYWCKDLTLKARSKSVMLERKSNRKFWVKCRWWNSF